MLKSFRFQAIILLTVSALLGYAAAVGNVQVAAPVDAAIPATQLAREESTVSPTCLAPVASCRATDANRGELLALAAHNQKVAAAAQKEGRKPNICIIWGDDIGGFNVSAYN